MPKSKRDIVVACVTYNCEQCGVVSMFDVCKGVVDPKDGAGAIIGVPAPAEIACAMCTTGLMIQRDQFSMLPERGPSIFPRLRVPSRRAAVDLSRRGRFEAQVVPREDP